MKILSRYYDLLAVGGVALALPLLLLVDLPLVRVPLGLIGTLLAPGYVLTALVFARRGAARGVEWLGLSFGLSVALLPLLALILDALPWGIRELPIAICLAAWTLILGAAAAWRRSRLLAQGATEPPPALAAAALRRNWLVLAGGAALVASLLIGTFAVVGQQDSSARLTEFYLLGAAGLAEDFPREVGQSQPFTVTVGLANREGAAQTYRLEARSQGRVVGALGAFELAAGLEREQPLTLTLPLAGADQKIEIELFRQADAAPYRRLELWLDVLPAKVP